MKYLRVTPAFFALPLIKAANDSNFINVRRRDYRAEENIFFLNQPMPPTPFGRVFAFPRPTEKAHKKYVFLLRPRLPHSALSAVRVYTNLLKIFRCGVCNEAGSGKVSWN